MSYVKGLVGTIVMVLVLVCSCISSFSASDIGLEERIRKLEQTIQMQQELLKSQQQMLETLKGELDAQKQIDQENQTLYQERTKAFETKLEGDKKTFFGPLLKPKVFNVTGRVQFRYQALNDNKDDQSLVVSQNAFDREPNDGFMIRRMRLHFFGDVTDRWSWMVQVSADGDHNEDSIDPDFADYRLAKDEVGLKLQDASITYHPHPYFNITMGQFKSRFSPSYLTSGPELPLCERPLVVDKLGRKREIGISIESNTRGVWDGRGYYKKPPTEPFYYALGIYNGNGYNRMRNDNENFMYTAMVLVRPLKGLALGTSYAYDKLGTDEEMTVLTDPEIAKFYVDDGQAIDWQEYYAYKGKTIVLGQKLHLWDLNAAYDYSRYHVQGEFINLDGNDVDRAWGYGIQGQIEVLDWVNAISCLEDWSLWGAVKGAQLTWRYDQLDPNVEKDNSFDSRWYTLGCNLFIHDPHLKWQVNYSWREEMHGKDIDNNILLTHFQLLF